MTQIMIQLTPAVAREMVSSTSPGWDLVQDSRFELVDPLSQESCGGDVDTGVLLWCSNLTDAILVRSLQEAWGRQTELWLDTSCRWWVVFSSATVDTWMTPSDSPSQV